MSPKTTLDHAQWLLARGMAPVAVPYRSKAAVLEQWQNLKLSHDDLAQHFRGTCNVGVLWGLPSGWVVDIDLDHPIAVSLADKFLPDTKAIWGRDSKPRSHWLYRLSQPTRTKKWQSKVAGMIVELRATGCQTIAPGSTHPSGERVRWDDDGEPATIDPNDLIVALDALAKAVRNELGERPHTADTPAPRPVSPTPRTASNYGREALRRESATVAATPEGARNDALNKAAFNVGTLVGGGEVDRADAEPELLTAARACGLPDAEALRTIASGIKAGMEHPRQRPAQVFNSNYGSSTDAGDTEPATPEIAPAFTPIVASALIREFPALRPVVIADLLREGETMNVVAAPKVGKSWLVHALAVAMVSGQSWLGKATTRGRVLLIDGELHRETLASRLRTTQTAMGVSDTDMAALQVWSVRGQRLTIDMIAASLQDVPTGEYRLLVFDAMYRFLPVDGEENSNETMTRIYNSLDGLAKHLAVSVVVVHHASKGNQSEKSVTDVGSGGGSQSRAADAHLILRPHEIADAVVVDAVVRSFPPMEPFVVRSKKPGWELAPGLDPTLLKKSSRGPKSKQAKNPAAAPVREWSLDEFATEIVGHGWSIRDDVLARARLHELTKAQAEALLKRAIAAGKVFRHQDGPSSPHCFSIDRPGCPVADIAGGMVEPSLAPSADALGGVGGTRMTPLPPSITTETIHFESRRTHNPIAKDDNR